jgi:hypothetical protein
MRIASVPAKIQTKYLSNTSLENYCYASLLDGWANMGRGDPSTSGFSTSYQIFTLKKDVVTKFITKSLDSPDCLENTYSILRLHVKWYR